MGSFRDKSTKINSLVGNRLQLQLSREKALGRKDYLVNFALFQTTGTTSKAHLDKTYRVLMSLSTEVPEEELLKAQGLINKHQEVISNTIKLLKELGLFVDVYGLGDISDFYITDDMHIKEAKHEKN